MTRTLHTGLIDYGSRVRLSFADPIPSNVGTVTGQTRVRESDGMRFWMVDYDEQSIEVAESVLVPQCEWAETFEDGYGLACSEPGVPTSFTIECGHDAASVVTFDDRQFGRNVSGFCLDHAVCVTLDLRLVDTPYEVESL